MIERNRAIGRRWFEEVWNGRRGETVEELFASEAVGHMEGAEVVGPAAFHEVRSELLTAFPDLRITIQDTVAEGSNVVVRWRATGSHFGDAFGIPATHAPIAVFGMTWLRIADGRIVEGWDAWNQGALLDSLRAAHERST
jgi:steroid delta-isomerase-like uncharacterized protein